MTFKDFFNEGLWDADGNQGEAATPLRKPSDGQPFLQYARGGKPRGNSGGMGQPGGQPSGQPMMMKKKMKKK